MTIEKYMVVLRNRERIKGEAKCVSVTIRVQD